MANFQASSSRRSTSYRLGDLLKTEPPGPDEQIRQRPDPRAISPARSTELRSTSI
jgi:hypothetical protein